MIRVVTLLAAMGLAACTGLPSVSPKDPTVPMTPAAALPNTQLGIEYMRRGQLTLSHHHLRRAIIQDPKLSVAHNAIAVLYQRLGDDHQAEAHFRRAEALAPDDSDIHNNFGGFLCALGRFGEAEAQFQLALANPLYKVGEKTYTNLGICNLRAGNRVRAERNIRAALAIAPTFAPALWQMAQLRWEAGDALKTRAFLQRYHAVSSSLAKSLLLSVLAERKLGDREAAFGFASRLREEFPDSAEARRLQEMDGT